MATRDLLHQTKLEHFKQWLIKDGWIILDTKGDYEVLRATKTGRKRPLIVYKKLYAKEHYSVDSRDISLVIKFLNSNKKGDKNSHE